MTYIPPQGQSSTPSELIKSRQRQRSEDAAVKALMAAKLNPADLALATGRVMAARRPLTEAKAIIRLASPAVPKSRRRRRNEDVAVAFLKDAHLDFQPDDLVTAIKRVRAARRPLLEARAVVRMAERAARTDPPVGAAEPPIGKKATQLGVGTSVADNPERIEVLALFTDSGTTMTTMEIASRIGLPPMIAEALLVTMPELEKLAGRWSTKT